MVKNDKVVYVQKDKVTDAVLYVGSGSESRAKKKKNGKNWIKYVLNNENGFYTEIVYSNLSVSESRNIEQELINLYNPIGNYLKTVSVERKHNLDFNEIFSYDETSPTYLVWKIDKVSGKGHKVTHKRIGKQAGCITPASKYSSVTVGYSSFRVHRVVWEMFNGTIPENCLIDHIDGDASNNSINNLRIVNYSQNARNRSHSNKIIWPGVYFSKTSAIAVVGNNKRVSFRISHYGLMWATRLAIMKRQQYMLSLENSGYTKRQNLHLIDENNLNCYPKSVFNPFGAGISFDCKNADKEYILAYNQDSKTSFCIETYGLLPATAAALQFKQNGFCHKDSDIDYSPPRKVWDNICYTDKKNITVVIPMLRINNKTYTKEISTRKHGLIPATKMAIEFRDEILLKYN